MGFLQYISGRKSGMYETAVLTNEYDSQSYFCYN